MSSDADGERHTSPAYRLIHYYREQAMGAIDRYNSAVVTQNVSDRVQRDLAQAALNYYYALHEHRDEDALEEPWDERGIKWLEEIQNETVTVEESLPRSNNTSTVTTKPALLAVDPERLKGVILELNDVAKELELSARVKSSTPRAEITDGMMEDIEEWRQANLE